MQTITKRDSRGRIMKGNIVPFETREKIRRSMMGENNHFFGKRHTEQSKQKIRENHPYQNIRGANHFNWKGGNIDTMRRLALQRDNYTCQKCKFSDKEIMVIDHIKPKSKFPELKTDLGNLMTLCPNCHAKKTLQDIKNGL